MQVGRPGYRMKESCNRARRLITVFNSNTIVDLTVSKDSIHKAMNRSGEYTHTSRNNTYRGRFSRKTVEKDTKY